MIIGIAQCPTVGGIKKKLKYIKRKYLDFKSWIEFGFFFEQCRLNFKQTFRLLTQLKSKVNKSAMNMPEHCWCIKKGCGNDLTN